MSRIVLTFSLALAAPVWAGLGCSSSHATSEAVLASSQTPPGAGLTVDHANYRGIESASSEVLGKVAGLRVFFAHASVGGNIVGGLRSLHEKDPARYRLAVQSAGERPGRTSPGTFYEFDRGNPGAQAKIDLFARYAAGGWAKPNVDAILDKFCYIDPDADFGRYTASMEGIERSHSGTVVLYATIPVCTQADEANDRREAFNERLRTWAKANKKPLLDIADIESHDPSGRANTYARAGRTYRTLFAGYTEDGGHLNAAGSEAVAKGVYSLLAKIVAR
ncbi:MAG: hypothetical protein KIS66_09210 [Fimbriimonadaceae bacterium]|nr:hypothetical protein [Fimbriimonadaceae bacterium]